MARLNVQVCRQSPGNRFITIFYSQLNLATGELTYVNAGHTPPLLLRANGGVERLQAGGVALGMFDGSRFETGRVLLQPDDLLAIYSDGITEAENPRGEPFDEQGLETVLTTERRNNVAATCAAVVRAVERHRADTRLADDLTLLLLRRSAVPSAAGV
jgi:sigma-B regulation protein RsbU (phosphoserine phosphatase)